jgi:tRNA/rRNA methyltransferase|tara:strand:- start:1603 stop:2325 length:723 start_codon:yes stop_codon:yes gene_type:complete
MQNKFSFILVNPQLGENIGSCARAMKNFGFTKLNIVSPRDGWPNTKARMTSVGASDIIKSAKIYKNVSDSVKKFDLVFATSARNRDINKKYLSITNFIKLILRNKNANIGLMFGPEASGLSNYDLSLSNFIVQIPTSNKLTSLNLSHAVIVISYEIYKSLYFSKFKKEKILAKLASKKNIQNLIKFLEQKLDEKKFFTPPEKKKSMILNINNIFGRLELNDKEMRILFSIFSSLNKKGRL